MAKQNVIDYYPVVGVTEMFNETLEVLETKLPTYFQGATEAYQEIGDKFSNDSNKKKSKDWFVEILPMSTNSMNFVSND